MIDVLFLLLQFYSIQFSNVHRSLVNSYIIYAKQFLGKERTLTQ